MKVTVDDNDGVLTISWDAGPQGIAVNTTGHVNMFGILFDNISNQNLQFTVVDPSVGTLGQQPTLQSLVCFTPTDPGPRPCGSSEPTVGFTVTHVPVAKTGTAPASKGVS